MSIYRVEVAYVFGIAQTVKTKKPVTTFDIASGIAQSRSMESGVTHVEVITGGELVALFKDGIREDVNAVLHH